MKPMKRIETRTKSQKLVHKKHEQIAQAAKELFSKKGYHSTSMRAISEVSGINLSYIYEYIRSKDDILYLFYLHVIKQFEETNSILDKTEEMSPVEQVTTFVRMVLENIHKYRDEVLTIYTETRHLGSDSLKAVLAMESQTTAKFASVIERGTREGVFKTKDPYMAANVLIFTLHIEPLRWWNLDKFYTFSRFVDLMTDFVLYSLGVDDKDKIL